MSYSWYWWCENCLPLSEISKFLSSNQDARDLGKRLLSDGKLTEAYPSTDIEIISIRNRIKRRCANCNEWHIKRNSSNRHICEEFVPYNYPECFIHNIKKTIFFLEKNAFIKLKSAYCSDEPEYISNELIYHAYFYFGYRYDIDENGLDSPGEVVSMIYFSSKNGNKYGQYSPYLFVGGEKPFPYKELSPWISKMLNS
jgi:hypothetical protein